MLIQLIELGEELGVPGPDLADGIVHQSPAYRRPFFNQVQIIRAEQHRVHHLAQFSGGFLYAVDGDLLGLAGLQQNADGLLPVVAQHLCQDLCRGKVEAHQLPVKAGAEAAAAGEHVHCLQQIGLALGVLAGDHVGAAAELHRFPLIVAKAVEGDSFDDHAFTTSKSSP